MNPSHIIPIFVVILFGIVILYRISLIITGSMPRRTRMIRLIAIGLGIVVVIVLAGLQISHIIY